MKLEKLAAALRELHGLGLTTIDVLIFDDIAKTLRQGDEATIMKIMNSQFAASPATVHSRIKKLCDEGYLFKNSDPKNLRFKTLEPAKGYDKLVERLGAI